MKWTGNQDAQGFELLNVKYENVSSLPTPYNTADKSRVIFVTTPGDDFGPYFGGETDWIKFGAGVSGGGGGKTIDFDFFSFGVDVSVASSIVLLTAFSISDKVRLAEAGQLSQISVSAKDAITGGGTGVLVQPTKNGLPFTNSALNTVLTTSSQESKYESSFIGEESDFDLVANTDYIGVSLIGDASNDTVTTDIHVKLVVTLT